MTMTPAERKEKERELQEARERANELEAELMNTEPPSWPITMDLQFFRHDDDNFDIAGEYLGFDDGTPEERQFAYSLLNLNVTIDIQEDGSVILTHCEGKPLPEMLNLSTRKGA